MHKQLLLIFTFVITLAATFVGHAAIYKHVDKDGHVTYSNVKIKGAKKIDVAPANSSFGTSAQKKYTPKSKKNIPSESMRVDKDTQKQRDTSRKEILLSELSSEKAALANAQQAYAEAAAKPEVSRRKNADGSTSTFRNVAKYQEKLEKIQMEIDVHERNITLLEKEISRLN